MRRLSPWERSTLKSCVQILPYKFTEDGIRLKGEAFFVEHDLQQLQLMRLHDAQTQDSTSEHYKSGPCKDPELVQRFAALAEKSRREATQYGALRTYVLEHGIPEDIRTSWTPRLPDWPASVMWG